MDIQTIERKIEEGKKARAAYINFWIDEIQDVIDEASVDVSDSIETDDDFLSLSAGMFLFISKFNQAYNRKIKRTDEYLEQLNEELKLKKLENKKAK